MSCKNQLKVFIYLDIPDHTGLTLTPSELELADFPKLVKIYNAKYSMEHGGVLLKPPIALPTKDVHSYDFTFVKPSKQVFTQEKEAVYFLKEVKIDKSRKGSKKVKNFLSESLTKDCNLEMGGGEFFSKYV